MDLSAVTDFAIANATPIGAVIGAVIGRIILSGGQKTGQATDAIIALMRFAGLAGGAVVGGAVGYGVTHFLG